jgi:hypothetical protein
MMSRKIMHLVDALAVTVGTLLIVAGVTGVAEAASLGTALQGSTSQPVMMLVGATLASFPASRRVLAPSLFSPHHLSECQDVADALRRVGLQQRVQSANLYMTDLSDEAITRAFGSDEAVLDWFGPAYADDKLRQQMTPEIVSRIEAVARRSGRTIGHA